MERRGRVGGVAWRHVRRIAREEVRQRWRALKRENSQYVVVLLGLPLGLLLVAGMAVFAFGEGRAVAAGRSAGVAATAGSVVATLVSYGLVLSTLRSLQGSAQPTSTDGLLTVVSHREAVLGTLAVECLYLGVLVGFPTAVTGLAFALGAASLATALLVVAVVPVVVAVPALVGVGLGYVVRNAVARSALLARYKSGLAVLALFAYFGVLFASDSGDVFAPVVGAVAASPVGWLGHLAVVPVADADPLLAAGAALLAPPAVAGLLALDSWLCAKRWYVTPATPAATAGGDSLPGLPGVSRVTAGVVRKTWARALRAPVRLVFVGYAGLSAAVPFVQAIQGEPAPWSTMLVVISGAWAAGAAFTLNPVGEEGAVLPTTLTTGAAGHPIVRGFWLAAAVPGLLATAALTGVFCLLAGVRPGDTALLVVFAGAVAALAPGVATGIGIVFPRTEAVDVIGDRKEVIPSLAAFVLYSIGLVVLTAPGWAVPPGRTRQLAAATLEIPPRVAGAAAAMIALAVLAVAGAASYRFAGSRFERHTLE